MLKYRYVCFPCTSIVVNSWYDTTKLQLYRVFILPVLLYGAETWLSPTQQLLRNIDAFDQWYLCRILQISHRVTHKRDRRRTDQPPLTHIIRATRLKFFGHMVHTDPSRDHSQALRFSVAPLPRYWNHRSGRPRQTWLHTVESDVAPLNIGLATAYHRAKHRQAWRSLVETETSTGQTTWRWWW